MITDKIVIENIKSISRLSVEFEFPSCGIIVVTGKNGTGKTSLVQALNLISDPKIFEKSASLNAICAGSTIQFSISGLEPFTFEYNTKLGVLDSKDRLPSTEVIIAELPIPYGARFRQFSLISSFDAEMRVNIAAAGYEDADELIAFLESVYSDRNFLELKVTKIKKYMFYFFLQENDYYLREDHFSSGEFYLIQIFRLITSGAKLILIDEIDVALDAAAQVKLYGALQPLLSKYNSRLVVVTHSLAFMETVNDGGLYYLENGSDEITILEPRSFGYVKSDLYGFRGKDRYILTEDKVLHGFIDFLIRENINYFYQYEIIEVGGQPQIDSMAKRNDSHQIFGPSQNLLIFVDKDIVGKISYSGASKILHSPVDDIELFLWLNKDRLLPDVSISPFAPAKRDKDTAKTYWKKMVNSNQKSLRDLYKIIVDEHPKETGDLVDELTIHLCL